ncbi:DUF6268 family outer membrane beta-barrel protein [Ulvibacter antarcticus]|uniref:DUF6268 domain-containing protein n=1 Tax=Ulvibacter antarcticus TaxID=442714 RepID=A0A3L9YB28_9FLAO|nr:DUF6268 family outer membrane beta-barrel protein [Ulvibacter antarcticus]RMA57911.1 hypothetical protein BXY75_2718 [Ulvibacter antarcticus]
MKKQLVFYILLLCLLTKLNAQSTDLARIEFLQVPFSNSNNSIQRYRALIQVPFLLSREKKNYLVTGIEYRYTDIQIKDAQDIAAIQAFGGRVTNAVQRMDLYLGYTWKLTDYWRIGVKGGVSIRSDFNDGLVSDDIVYDGAIYAIWSNSEDSPDAKTRLILGLAYSTTPGRNYPLPLINLNKEFRPNWTYTIGVPKSNLRYYLNDNHKDALQAFVTLDNFSANIQQNFPVQSGQTGIADNISMTNVVAGLGYEHFFTKHLLYYAYGGHTLYNNFRLEDKDGAKVYSINDENSLYFRTGIKFKY